MRAVRRSYGHNKHISAIWRAQNAVKREDEGASRGDGVLVWPLDQRFLKLKLKLNIISDDIFFHILVKQILTFVQFFSRASNSSIKVKYKGYSVAYYYATPYRTVGGGTTEYLSATDLRSCRSFEFYIRAILTVSNNVERRCSVGQHA